MLVGIIIYIISLLLVAVVGQLETIFQWRYIDYVWPSEAEKQQAIQSGDYNVTEPMPMDFAVSQDKRVFISFSNIFGVPARLAEVTSHTESSGPLLKPYPSWDWTNKSSCDAILKPDRIEIDECNRLWVLDSATTLPGKEATQCHPKLLAFDIWTDTLLTKISIPKNIAANARTNQSSFTNIRVETGGYFCENTTATIAQDSKQLQWVDGIKIIPKNIFGVEEVWFITNRLIHHNRRQVWNISEINYRIFRSPVKDLIAGTKCELPKETRDQLKKLENP
ncbi:hypothetical protein QAD02_023845 [Eretmocerus hayati]|uniref:Uncharacterized protein n=1 Tax=Eretmocerus hayati TaxID=131215 RepID=A0ACC2Q1W1_9HYME|nr:hypothetical protein QAD02_023845 [Eretmocerus hayati]